MEEKQATVTQGHIPYLVAGSGPTIVFLHGGVATPYAYIPLLEALAPQYTVIAPTHPGHGKSFPISNEWTLSEFVSVYHEFFQSTGVQPDFLVGHSFGGTLALLLAAAGKGKGAVAMDCPGLPFPFSPSEYINIMLEEAKDVVRHNPDIHHVGQIVGAAGTLVETIIQHHDDIPWLYRTVPVMNIQHELLRIRIPVSVLWGEQDKIIPKDVGERMSKLIAGSAITVFPDRGHNYPVTAHDFTATELRKILVQ